MNDTRPPKPNSTKNFWQELARPFFCLAPMADVTDPAFRRIIAKHKRGPVVLWTEFVSADGLCHPIGRPKLLPLLQYSESERPIVAQIFSAHPDKIHDAAKLIAELGFDGVDINMGCPDRSVEKQGAGAALIKNPALAREIIAAAKAGAGSAGWWMPVSVKTRLGYNKDELETWLPELLAEAPAAITIHARTRKEMSKVPARWERVKRAVEIRNQLGSQTLIIGNGDVVDLVDANKKAGESEADGVMFGRAIFGQPWLFAEREAGPIDRLRVLDEHIALFDELLGGVKSFAVMKKHFKAYLSGLPEAKAILARFMATSTAAEADEVVKEVLSSL